MVDIVHTVRIILNNNIIILFQSSFYSGIIYDIVSESILFCWSDNQSSSNIIHVVCWICMYIELCVARGWVGAGVSVCKRVYMCSCALSESMKGSYSQCYENYNYT